MGHSLSSFLSIFIFHCKFTISISVSVCRCKSKVLTNVGRNDLEVFSVRGDGVFSCELPQGTVSTLEDLEVTLTCVTPEDGNFNGQVVLKTNAGEISIPCKAIAENRLTIGNNMQLCSTFPCDPSLFSDEVITQSLYKDSRLASLNGYEITSITFSLIDYITTESNWDEGRMIWEVGSTDAENLYKDDAIIMPEGLTTVYEGPMLNFIDKQLVVTFDEPVVWDGSDRLIYRLSVMDSPINSGFLYTRGTPTVYIATTQTSKNGIERKESIVPDIKIEYKRPTGPEVGVLEVNAPGVIDRRYFNLAGVQIEHPSEGFYIEVRTHEDGRVTSRKIHIK